MTDKPKIVSLCGRTQKGPEPNTQVMALLDEVRPMAEAGQVRSLALAFTYEDGSMTAYSVDNDHLALMGAVQILSAELLYQATAEDD